MIITIEDAIYLQLSGKSNDFENLYQTDDLRRPNA